jgi:hypothetical protein
MFAWISSVALADPLVAVVVIDQAARDEGYALELEDLLIEDALPLDVGEGERVRIVDPDGGRHELDVAPGEAWEVSGPRGEAWMSRLGEEVRTDLLVVRGDPEAVEALARALGAEVVASPERTLLVREGILFDAPWAEVDGLDRLDEVGLVRVEDAAPARPASPATLAVRPPSPVAIAPPSLAAAIAPEKAEPRVEALPTGLARPRVEAPPEAPAEEEPVVEEPVAEEPVPELLAVEEDPLDPVPYLGVWMCGDGTGLVLSAGGFTSPDAKGTWYVSSPGVVRLLVRGAVWGRAAIETDRHYCRAVWGD